MRPNVRKVDEPVNLAQQMVARACRSRLTPLNSASRITRRSPIIG